MIRAILKAALAVFGIAVLLAGWGYWAYSGHAPRFVSRSFDRVAVAVFEIDPITRCLAADNKGSHFVGMRRCLDFGQTKRFKGIYIQQSEGSAFIADAVPSPIYCTKDSVYLLVDENTDHGGSDLMTRSASNRGLHIYELEIVGKMAPIPEQAFTLARAENILIVDKVLSVRLLESTDGGYLVVPCWAIPSSNAANSSHSAGLDAASSPGRSASSTR